MDTQSSSSTTAATQPSSANDFDRKHELANIIRRAGTATITFLKKDGTERVMKATLDADVVVPYERKTERVKKPNPNVLSVWDIEKNMWRSVNVDQIISIYYTDGDNDYSQRY